MSMPPSQAELILSLGKQLTLMRANGPDSWEIWEYDGQLWKVTVHTSQTGWPHTTESLGVTV